MNKKRTLWDCCKDVTQIVRKKERKDFVKSLISFHFKMAVLEKRFGFCKEFIGVGGVCVSWLAALLLENKDLLGIYGGIQIT